MSTFARDLTKFQHLQETWPCFSNCKGLDQVLAIARDLTYARIAENFRACRGSSFLMFLEFWLLCRPLSTSKAFRNYSKLSFVCVRGLISLRLLATLRISHGVLMGCRWPPPCQLLEHTENFLKQGEEQHHQYSNASRLYLWIACLRSSALKIVQTIGV